MTDAAGPPAAVPSDAMHAGFSEFYAAAYGPLCGQLYLHCGSMVEAQDVVQDAFCRALARWKTISTYDDPTAWVRRVAWNLATSRWRRLRRLRDLTPQLAGTTTSDGPEPDRVAVRAALATLSVRQRQAVVLHYITDMSVVDIAELMNAPAGTVKAWLHRGRTQLATVLGDDPIDATHARAGSDSMEQSRG